MTNNYQLTIFILDLLHIKEDLFAAVTQQHKGAGCSCRTIPVKQQWN